MGQYWRAATLEGWRLHHDPNYNQETTGAQVEGNNNRGLWKCCCWNMATDVRLDSSPSQRDRRGSVLSFDDVHEHILRCTCLCVRTLESVLQEYIHQYERAMYAVFSGNLAQLLTVCETWEDVLWAYTKCMIDVRVENELRHSYYQTEELAIPKSYWDTK